MSAYRFVRNSVRKKMLLSLSFLAVLSGCSVHLSPAIERLPERVELNGMPVFRGNIYQSGPGALAAMLAQQRIATSPGLLEKPLQLPKEEAHLPANMLRVAREYGLVVYPLAEDLQEVLAQVAAGYPVLIRLEEGTILHTPRYAVVVGYDRNKQRVMLNIGMYTHTLLSFSSFESAWQRADHWAVLIQAPTQLPAQVDAQRWKNAAQQLAQAGQEQAAALALRALEKH